VATEIRGWTGYHARSVSEETPAEAPAAEAPVDPLFTHAASPFERTEPPAQVGFPSPPDGQVMDLSATWVTYKSQIYFGFAILAYLMVLVGSVTVVQANPDARWKFYVAVLPVIPAALVIWLTVKALGRMDEVQKRKQMQALGFSMVATGLLTFGYGFLEGAGLPHLNSTFVLPLMAVLWGLGLFVLALRYRFRR
jgi:hypothetical protein